MCMCWLCSFVLCSVLSRATTAAAAAAAPTAPAAAARERARASERRNDRAYTTHGVCALDAERESERALAERRPVYGSISDIKRKTTTPNPSQATQIYMARSHVRFICYFVWIFIFFFVVSLIFFSLFWPTECACVSIMPLLPHHHRYTHSLISRELCEHGTIFRLLFSIPDFSPKNSNWETLAGWLTEWDITLQLKSAN